ncbi:MAG: hypothetical protein H6835_05570 [Planctomycetes bacterium]|nr:hypothetical protein [Planctomycetota bacterium]
MRRNLHALLLASGLAACATSDPGLPPTKVTGLPWSDAPADRLALSARQAYERNEPRRALELVEQLLSQAPRHVDALRLRQDLLRERGRLGVLLDEAQRAVAAHPDDGLWHYLLARVEVDPAAKLAGFRRAAALAPDSLWPWLGLAHTLRTVEPERALEIYSRLLPASGRHPLVMIAFAAALRERGRDQQAMLLYQAMRDDLRLPGVGDLGLGELAMTRDDQHGAWVALLSALRARPFDVAAQALVYAWLGQRGTFEHAQQLGDALRARPERLAALAQGGGAVPLAALLTELGQPLLARRLLAQRVADVPEPSARRALRRSLLALGDVSGFLGRLEDDVPVAVVGAERNQLRGRWLTLLNGPWRDAVDDADTARALLVALRDVGWLQEVELLAEWARGRWPDGDAAFTALQDEVRVELAFEAGVRRLLYHGYQVGDDGDLRTVLRRLRELSLQVLQRDVVGDPEVFAVPLVGEMIDPFTGALAEHLARYNRHFVLGRRAGGTAEGMMMTRLSLAELPPDDALPLVGRCYEVVAIDRDVKALAGVLGGDLAGVALLNHFLVDHDAVVDWAEGIRRRRRVAREDGMALVTDPLPAQPVPGALDAAWRLSVASPVPDELLPQAVLEMIRVHERQHLCDSFHYLPIGDNLWRGLGLLLQTGVSPVAVEGEMERRAELAALARSPHTELVLAHIVDFYGEPPLDSPHHRGFSELVEQLRDRLVRGGLSVEQAWPARWHELDMQLVRDAASSLLDELPR